MIEQLELMIANRYFERRMRTIFVDRVCAKGIETFEQYLSYRYRDNCYYYSGYAIIGLKDDDYLMRGDLCISGDFIWGNGGYSHGWVEFKYNSDIQKRRLSKVSKVSFSLYQKIATKFKAVIFLLIIQVMYMRAENYLHNVKK